MNYKTDRFNHQIQLDGQFTSPSIILWVLFVPKLIIIENLLVLCLIYFCSLLFLFVNLNFLEVSLFRLRFLFLFPFLIFMVMRGKEFVSRRLVQICAVPRLIVIVDCCNISLWEAAYALLLRSLLVSFLSHFSFLNILFS